MRIRAAIALLPLLALAACAGHTSEARRGEIAAEIAKTNYANLLRAMNAKLRARGATALKADTEPLVVRDLDRCLAAYSSVFPEPPAEVEIQRGGGKKLVAPCTPFADAFRAGAAEARTDDGKDVLVIRANQGEILASTADGKILVLRPRLNVVERRVVRVEGTCDRMPGVMPDFMPIEHAYVLAGRRREEVVYEDLVYDGLDEDVRCDDYVY